MTRQKKDAKLSENKFYLKSENKTSTVKRTSQRAGGDENRYEELTGMDLGDARRKETSNPCRDPALQGKDIKGAMPFVSEKSFELVAEYFPIMGDILFLYLYAVHRLSL